MGVGHRNPISLRHLRTLVGTPSPFHFIIRSPNEDSDEGCSLFSVADVVL